MLNYILAAAEGAAEGNGKMGTLIPIIIVAAVVFVLLVAIIIVIAVKNGKKKEHVGEFGKAEDFDDQKLIAANADMIDVLIALASANDEAVVELDKMQGKMKYLLPSDKKEVYQWDEKIKRSMEDFKIFLSKKGDQAWDENDKKKYEEHMRDLNVLLAEREQKR